jgi:CRP-like cAMP-binding protein
VYHDVESIGFVKTWRSDVSERHIATLLREVQASGSGDIFRGFTDDDFNLMSQLMTVFQVSAGERIMCRGERSSFVCLVLAGSLRANVSEFTTIPIKKGQFIGDVAAFEGGLRVVDVDAATAGTIAGRFFTVAACSPFLLSFDECV